MPANTGLGMTALGSCVSKDAPESQARVGCAPACLYTVVKQMVSSEEGGDADLISESIRRRGSMRLSTSRSFTSGSGANENENGASSCASVSRGSESCSASCGPAQQRLENCMSNTACKLKIEINLSKARIVVPSNASRNVVIIKT